MSDDDGRLPPRRPGRESEADGRLDRLVEDVGYLLALHWAGKRGLTGAGKADAAAAAPDNSAGGRAPTTDPSRGRAVPTLRNPV